MFSCMNWDYCLILYFLELALLLSQEDCIFHGPVFQVEIVMGLEEAFKITVEESSAQSIATVEDAANLIDELVAAKSL